MNDPTTAGLRTSGSNPSLRPISNRTGSTRSTTSHFWGHRHALLKSNIQRESSIEKDVPVPPVLTRNYPIRIGEGDTQNLGPQRSASRIPTLVENPAIPAELVPPDPASDDNKAAAKIDLPSSADSYDHFRTWRLPVSKVRPAVYDAEDRKVEGHGELLFPSSTPSGDGYPVENHFQQNRINTPKVRPLMEFPPTEASRRHEENETTDKVETSDLANQLHVQGEEELQKVAPYWGFLPRPQEGHGSPRLEVDPQENRRAIASSHRESIRLSEVNSQASSTSIQPKGLDSKLKQENIRQTDETNGRDTEASNGHSENRIASGNSGKSSGRSIVSSPPASLSRYTSRSVDKEEGPLPQKLNTRRTAKWLRGLLGLPEADTSATLTKLPNNAPRRQDSYGDTGSPVSGAPTYSAENIANKEAIDDAMHSLEHLITEALSLADEVGKREYGHVDDGDLPLTSTSEVSIITRSVDESLRRGSSEQGGEILRDRPLRLNSVYPELGTNNKNDSTGVTRLWPEDVPSRREVREYIRNFHEPQIGIRGSSKIIYTAKDPTYDDSDSDSRNRLSEIRLQDRSVCSLDGGTSDEAVDISTQYSTSERQHPGPAGRRFASRHVRDKKPLQDSGKPGEKRASPVKHTHGLRNISLRNRSHSPARKRFVAAVACISTALIGVLVGIYAGLVPSIQYYIADFHHYAILGNVGMYLGMALPNLFFWPLPLLHGRKPYVVGSLCIAMPLLFPQALAIGARRSPYTYIWRLALLLPRALMGFVLGFASMNFHSTLTDLFGASLMSRNPHQEVVDEYDVRRHGGGLGIWLGIWTWCFIGSLAVGFVVGAVVIEYLQPAWGLYISIIIIAAVLLLNVFSPEVRRSAWRRSVAEVRKGEAVSRRLARGEVMMHRVQTGPRWWGQEVYHGVALSLEMLRQPGFAIMAVYSAWIYAQVVLLIVLLGSLTSKFYRFRSPYVAAVVSSVGIGAFVAIPFQKANFFSRARSMSPMSNTMTFDKKIIRSSHLVRRSIFTLVLPIAGIAYTVVSTGPPVHVVLPSLFAAIIGFLSCLAISECNGMMMEAWDCSDLQPGMTGRSTSAKDSHKRTNYSSFPRVTAGWNFIQSLGFVFAAGATALGGLVTRHLGQRAATGVVAGILFILSLLLLGTLVRFKRIQIIPDCTCSEMDRWTKERRVSLHNWAAAKEKGDKGLSKIPEDDVGWRPAIIGNPVDRYRRINILELGSLTRWTEIRKKNSLIDENAHLNRQAVALARDELQHSARHSSEKIMQKVSRRSPQSKCSHSSSDDEVPGGRRNNDHSASSPASASATPQPDESEHRPGQPRREVSDEHSNAIGRELPEAGIASSMSDRGYIRSRDRLHNYTSQSRDSTGSEIQPKRDRSPSIDDAAALVEASGGGIHHAHEDSR
ncbi:hypothetical protein F5Y14DRAFT_452780 [Nemania sp. NC0429]|nr:hypothetical protein F5Y14DRAFT_452780 [Nemania sp. NC0429]